MCVQQANTKKCNAQETRSTHIDYCSTSHHLDQESYEIRLHYQSFVLTFCLKKHRQEKNIIKEMESFYLKMAN